MSARWRECLRYLRRNAPFAVLRDSDRDHCYALVTQYGVLSFLTFSQDSLLLNVHYLCVNFVICVAT